VEFREWRVGVHTDFGCEKKRSSDTAKLGVRTDPGGGVLQKSLSFFFNENAV
jgi:hypothetical protein